jgi:hypothetical protein
LRGRSYQRFSRVIRAFRVPFKHITMRPELELIQQIENYLLNKMSESDRKAFEQKMQSDAALKADVEKQRLLMEGVKRSGVKQQINTARKKYFMKKNIFKWGLGGAGLLAATLVVLFLSGNNPFGSAGSTDPYALPEVNEQNEKVWADADKYLPSQFFSIDNSKDTVIETEGGIVFAIPQGCFLDENGNPVKGSVKLNVKEALKPEDIMKGGMDTRSDGNLLETGGMFYLNPTQDGKNLKIDPSKGIYTEVPSDGHKPGMMLFEGQRMPDGTINWKNPKPTEKFLTPVDITSLNFYPPLYLDSLKQMGYDVKNKMFTDSLYYSFARLFGLQTDSNSKIQYEDTIRASYEKDSATVRHILINYKGAIQADPKQMRTMAQAKKLADSLCSALKRDNIYFPQLILRYSADSGSISGFNFVTNKKEYKPASGLGIYRFHRGQMMPQFEDAIWRATVRDIVVAQTPYGFHVIEIISKNSANTGLDGINPAKIKTIWDKQYNNTLLATKEFEERLKVIHNSCNENILDLYINNLDKRISGIDSIAAGMDEGAHSAFMDFASRNDGRVKIKEGHMRKLQEYYAKKSKAYTDAIAKTQQEFWEKQSKMDQDALQKLSDRNSKDARIKQENFDKEFKHNLEDVARQLGINKTGQPTASVGATVTAPGWCNIDRYVEQITQNRESGTITDLSTGKKAKILYQPFTLFVGGAERWDRLTAYLLPDSLYSFQRMKQEGFDFKEQINASMNYDVISIAYKGDQVYYFEAKDIKQGKLEAKWQRISEKELEEKLSGLKSRGYKKDVLEDVAYTRFEIKDDKRKAANVKLSELTWRIQQVIFPCIRGV